MSLIARPSARRRTAPRWLAVALLGLAIILVAAPGPALQAQAIGIRLIVPVETGISQALAGVAHSIDTVRQAGKLAAQNRAYQEENARLQAEVVRMRELELENLDLRRLLDLRGRAPLG